MITRGNKVRVLHVGKFYPPYAGGMETHLKDLCTGLTDLADVKVIVSNAGRRSVTDKDSGVTVHRAGTFATISSTAISPGIVSALRRSPADIVHIHWPNPTAVLAYLASGHTGRLILTYHSDIVRQKLLGALLRPVFDLAMARCAAIICTSQAYVDTSAVLQRFSHLCHVIPYGISTDGFASPDWRKVETLRRQYGPRTVLAVGRLVYYKGFEYLIRAMRAVNARAVIVGDGPLRERLENLAADCGVSDRVTFAGEKQGSDLVAHFHAADLFVLPSVARSEAFGIVQLEAMAAGKPVINTNLDSGVPSISLDRVTGLTVPPADPESLAAAINQLMSNDELRSRYGKAARMRVANKFTVKTMIQETSELYRQVLDSSPAVGEEKLVLSSQY